MTEPRTPPATGAPKPKDHPNSREAPLEPNEPTVSPDDYPDAIGGKPNYKQPGKA